MGMGWTGFGLVMACARLGIGWAGHGIAIVLSGH
jgi:hypothetical protein